MPRLEPPPNNLTLRLRQATRAQHTQAERSGLMRSLLQGRLGLPDYVRLLQDLLAIYRALEAGLQQHAQHPQLAPLVLPALWRVPALADDLAHWCAQLPTSPGAAVAQDANPGHPAATRAGLAYAQHLRALTDRRPLLLAAHAYVRYLGDLNGGQVLARRVAEGLGASPARAADDAPAPRTGVAPGLRFYDFGSSAQVAALAAALRAGLDQLAGSEAEAQALVDEACASFDRHCDLFNELATSGALPTA